MISSKPRGTTAAGHAIMEIEDVLQLVYSFLSLIGHVYLSVSASDLYGFGRAAFGGKVLDFSVWDGVELRLALSPPNKSLAMWGPCRVFRRNWMALAAIKRNWKDQSVRSWTFRQWKEAGCEFGFEVKLLQSPLYYFMQLQKMESIFYRTKHGHVACSKASCGSSAAVQDPSTGVVLCSGCAVNRIKRGTASTELCALVQRAPRKYWAFTLSACGRLQREGGLW